MSLSMYERIAADGPQVLTYSNVYQMLREVPIQEDRGIWTEVQKVGVASALGTARSVVVVHRLMTDEEEQEAIIDMRMCPVLHMQELQQEEWARKRADEQLAEFRHEHPDLVAWTQYTDGS